MGFITKFFLRRKLEMKNSQFGLEENYANRIKV